MTEVSKLLFAAAFTYLVSLSAGKTLLQALRVKLYRSEEYFFGFVLGSAILSTLVFALTAAGLAYAGVFRSYGQMLILDVGGDILVVVSGLDALYPEAGQWVLAGEPIGRMADQKSPSPELYLEIRRSGQPVDPEKWLGRGA